MIGTGAKANFIHRIGGGSVDNLRLKPTLIMEARTVKFLDPTGIVLATARVANEGSHYGGSIDLTNTPGDLRALFDEFEEIVNTQMFAFLDEIQGKIASFPLRAVFDDGHAVGVNDLQVFPGAGDVSFKIAEVARVEPRSA